MMKYETSKLAYRATSVHSTMLDKYFRVLNHRWKDRTVIYASNKGRAMPFSKNSYKYAQLDWILLHGKWPRRDVSMQPRYSHLRADSLRIIVTRITMPSASYLTCSYWLAAAIARRRLNERQFAETRIEFEQRCKSRSENWRIVMSNSFFSF